MKRHTHFGASFDTEMMQHALALARQSATIQEVPIGALVVDPEGMIIGQGYNTVEQDHSQLSHAECHALRVAGRHLGTWRLTNCWIYVTIEPCIMCISAIALSRCMGVVYGAASPLFGFSRDTELQSWVHTVQKLAIISGVCEPEAAAMMQEFFHRYR